MSWQPPGGPGARYGATPGFAPPPGHPGSTYGSGPTPWGPAPGLVYASFMRRLAGYLLDGVIIGVPSGTLLVVTLWSTISSYINQVVSAVQANVAPPQLVFPVNTLAIFALAECVVGALYFGVLVAAWGSTVGQRAARVRVVREENPSRRLPLGRAVFRAIVWWAPAGIALVPVLEDLAGLVVLLAFLWVIWDPRRQGLHDKLGRSLVVTDEVAVPASPYEQWPYPYPHSYPYPY